MAFRRSEHVDGRIVSSGRRVVTVLGARNYPAARGARSSPTGCHGRSQGAADHGAVAADYEEHSGAGVDHSLGISAVRAALSN